MLRRGLRDTLSPQGGRGTDCPTVEASAEDHIDCDSEHGDVRHTLLPMDYEPAERVEIRQETTNLTIHGMRLPS